MNKIYQVLLLVIFLLSLLFILKTLFLDSYPDFSVYYYGARIALDGGNFYLGGKDLFTSFVYPPFVALFFIPFTLLPYFVAGKLWTLISILCLISSLFILYKIFNQKIFSTTSILLSSLVFLAFPTKFTLGMGQINLLILFLFILSIYLANKKKDSLSGVFLGLSIVLKLFPVLLLLYFLILTRWRIVTCCAAIIVSSLVLPLVLIKPEVNVYFIEQILPTIFGGWKGDYYNQSLSGFLARTGWLSIQELLRIVISVVLFGISSFAIFKNQSNKSLINLKIGILITLSLIINNFSWQHHFVWLIFPFFATFFFLREKKRSLKYYSVLLLSYVLVALNLKNPLGVNIIFQSHVFYGAVLLWALNVYMILKPPIDKKA